MKRFSEQLNKKSQTVKMTAAERRELKARLVSYMEYHPLPKTTQQRNAEQYLEAEQKFSFLHFNTPHLRGFMTMFAAFVLIIVPVVAEKSVPGDVLYPVKVHFTEEIRSTLTVSPYAKIELETQLLERRIAEARLLASEGKLTPEVEEEFAQAVKAHSNAAQNEIELLRISDRDEAAIAEIAFGSALSVQSGVLEGTLKRTAETTGEATAEGAPVTALAFAVEEARKGVEAKQNQQNPSFEKLMARIESESTRAFELFADVKKVATDAEVIDVERRMQDIERKITEAVLQHDEAVISAPEEEGAIATQRADISQLRTALSDLQKLISFMTDIDVRQHMTVDELVPMTPTKDEIRAALMERQIEIDTRLEATREAFASYEGEQAEKIAAGLEEVAAFASSSAAALANDSLTVAAQAALEAEAYLGDIEKMITVPEVLPEAPEEPATTTIEDVTQEGVEPEKDATEVTTETEEIVSVEEDGEEE